MKLYFYVSYMQSLRESMLRVFFFFYILCNFSYEVVTVLLCYMQSLRESMLRVFFFTFYVTFLCKKVNALFLLTRPS